MSTTGQRLSEQELDAAIASTQECRRVDQTLGDDGMPELKGWYLFACIFVIGLAAFASVFAPPFGFIKP